MKLAVITECALSRKHGTGAQHLRILQGVGLEFFHLYLTSFYAGDSEVTRSYRLEDPRWTGRGRRYVGRLERLLGMNWWQGEQIDATKLRGLLSRNHLQCEVAYVSVAGEPTAKQLNSVLSVLGVPYVTHVMDINYDQGFDPATMPGLQTLFNGAATNIGLGEAIVEQIRRFGCSNTVEIPIGQDPTDQVARPPSPDGPINLLTVGRPYERGTQILVEAWPELKRRLPRIRLIYAGQHPHAIPDQLRAEIDDRGYISDKQTYDRLVAESHVAYLSGPSEMDHYGRFSIPSRTSDFLMAGLPVVAAVPQESATARFLQPLIPTSAKTMLSADALVEAVLYYASAPATWTAASAAAREFALANLSMAQVSRRIGELLKAAANRQG